MRTKTLIFLYATACIFAACSPEEEGMYDFSQYVIDKVVCQAQNNYLVADNESELNLEAVIYVKSGTYTDINGDIQPTYKPVPVDRQRTHDIKFFKEDGTPVTNPYKRTSATPSIERFYATVDGIRSSKPILQLEAEHPKTGTPIAVETGDAFFEVNVRAALPLMPKKRIPVIFHIIDSKYTASVSQLLSSDVVYYVIDQWNSVFGRRTDRASNGANPNIEFVPALRDPAGKKLLEPGIHYVLLTEAEEVTYAAQGRQFIWGKPALSLYWDCDRYLNVWVYINAPSNLATGATNVLNYCYPDIYPEGAYDDPEAPGLPEAKVITSLTPDALAAWKLNPGGADNLGIVEKAGLLFVKPGFATHEQDFVGRMAVFLGVIPNKPLLANTSYDGTSTRKYISDLCDDTHPHDIWFYGSTPFSTGGRESSAYGSARTKYMKSAPWLIFQSTNVVEDFSPQTTITQDQVKRINWVLENAAGRQAWRNTTAID